MRRPSRRIALLCLGAATLLLSACGKDFNGFGEMQGWGGYTKQFGDVDGYGDKQVGLCTYTGGCMPENAENGVTANSYKGTDSSGDHAGSMDSGSSSSDSGN